MTSRVITVAQQKGGSGKTTLAVNLACALHSGGASVALLDTDPQGSLGRWFLARRDGEAQRPEPPGAPAMEFSTASAWGVSYECEKLRRTHDYVIVDTPPKIDADLRPALRECDLVLVPLSVSRVDLWATDGLIELVRREDRPVLMVLNRAAPRARLTAEVEAAMAETGAPRAATVLRNRVVYAETLGKGRSVGEAQPNGPAAQEIAALLREIEQRLAEL